MSKKIILGLLFLATIAVAYLYRKPLDSERGGVKNISSNLVATKEKALKKTDEEEKDIKKVDPVLLIKEPFTPERPLAEVSDAEVKKYDEIEGSYIYSSLGGTTLSRVRKMADKAYPGSITLDKGKIAIKDGVIVAGAFVFDMTTIKSLEKNSEALTNYLKSDKYLHVKKYPIASFVLQETNESKLTGVLTMGEVSKKISFPALILIEDDAVRIRADFSLDKRLFGLPLGKRMNPFLDIHIQWILRK